MSTLKKICEESAKLLHALANNNACMSQYDVIRNWCVATLAVKGKILVAGNGGSFADASHFAGELVGRFMRERRALPVLTLGADTAITTAWSNDYSFDDVFARQLQAYAHAGDIFLAISTSGNSKNLIRAAQYARDNNIFVLSLLGRDGGQLLALSDCALVVPHSLTSRIQEAHICILHALAQDIEDSVII